MKRSHPEEDANSGSEGTEMDVDDEAKAERSEEDDDSDAEMEAAELTGKSEGVVPFLDTFYGLSSANPQERAQASQAMLHYCLVGPEANSKDASYALRRLMNGLCSGRAAARQGNASALATLLKVAFDQGAIQGIQNEAQKEGEEEITTLAFIRQKLLAATEPGESQGKRKSSEDRDYRFGRLFGILGVVRSGILLPSGETRADLDDIIAVSSGLVEDLAELYGYKKWMREPAAHAVGTLLNAFYALCPDSSDAARIVEHLVENVIVPKFLLTGDSPASKGDPLLASYSAEQVAIAANIQSHIQFHPAGLPAPIQKSVLTKETIPLIASALSETSAVVLPRTHLVWDSIWPFITDSDTKQGSRTVDVRKSRKSSPMGNESVHDVLECIIQHVVVERLLGIDKAGKPIKEAGKSTHERRALALCILRNLLGVEFVSSIAGRTRVILEPEIIETVVLSPLLVRRVFIDVIAAGKGGQKQSEHMLKPLALQVLQSMTDALHDGGDEAFSEESSTRRLAVARALLKCDPRFDTRTKSMTVANIVGIGSEFQLSEGLVKLWNNHISFLERQVASGESPSSEQESTGVSSYDAVGFADLLFSMGKHVLRVDAPADSNLVESKTIMTRRLLGFMMTGAFFDCMSIKDDAQTPTSSGKKKKKKSKKGKQSDATDFAVEAATFVKAQRSELTDTIPYSVRSVLSARFFSLLAEIVGSSVHSSGNDKYSNILDLVSLLIKSWKRLESVGVKSFAPPLEDSEDEASFEDLDGFVSQLQKAAQEHTGTAEDANKRFSVGCALLSSTLFLHFLGCGRPEDAMEDEDPNADEEGDAEEVASCIADVKHIADLYAKGPTADENPLSSLAELCANILSSHLGSGSQLRGASPKLLREAVKFTWMGGLSLSAASSEETIVDSQVVDILLGSMGAIDDEAPLEDAEMEEEESESEDEDSDDDDAVFADAAGVPGILGDDASEDGSKKSDDDDDDDSEKELEVDSTKLQTMLEDDSDADIDEFVLEHHEGADAALAKLIQLKQDARKAGQLARERMEIARQLRCALLLETLLNGKPDGWGALLRTDIILQMVIPLLNYRRKLEKAISKGTGKGSESGIGEKRAMLERITSLLKTKIFKMKFAAMEWTESFDTAGFAEYYSAELIGQAKDRVSKDHQSVCSAGLIAMVRAIPDSDEKLKCAHVFAEAVAEWSTKRTSRLESALFDALVHQNPVVAQAVLVEPLAVAAASARTTFLKSESFRLLSLLYNPNLNPNTTAMEKSAVKTLIKTSDSLIQAVILAAKDSEMQKTKRIREVLKTAEKVISFLDSSSCSDALSSSQMKKLESALGQVSDDSDSKGVKNDCDKLQSAMKALLETTPAPMEDDPAQDDDEAAGTSESKSKKGKKKGKKSKGKKKR